MRGKVSRLLCVLTVVFLLAGNSLADKGMRKQTREMDFANGLMTRGMFDMAAEQYENFISDYPESQLIPKAKFNLARAYFFDQNNKRSKQIFEEFIDKYPESSDIPEAKLRLGQLMYSQGDFTLAERLLAEAHERLADPRMIALASYYHTLVNFRAGNLEKAEKILLEAISTYEDSPFKVDLYMLMGDVYRAQLRAEEAILSYQKAVGMTGDPVVKQRGNMQTARVYDREGEHEKADRLLENILSETNEATFSEAALLKAGMEFDRGNYQKAAGTAKKYAEGLSGAPKGRLFLIAGNSYFRLEEFDDAVETFKTVARGKFSSEIRETAFRSWVSALIRMEHFQNALDLVSDVKEYLPEPGDLTESGKVEITYYKARALNELGRKSDAVEIYKNVFREYPGSPLARESLHEIVWVLGEIGRDEDALEFASDFIYKYPEDERFMGMMFKKSELGMNLGDMKGSRDLYKEIIDLAADPADKHLALYHLAQLHFSEAEYSEAIIKADRIIKEAVDQDIARHAQYTKARAFQLKGKTDEAISTYEEIRMKGPGPEYLSSLQQLAFAYYQEGSFDEAARNYHELIVSVDEPSRLDPELFFWVVDHLLGMGDPERADDVLTVLKDTYPAEQDSPVFQYFTAEVHRYSGRHEEAVEAYERTEKLSIRGDRYFQRAHLGMARVEDLWGDKDKALERYEKVLGSGDDAYSEIRARYYRALINYEAGAYSEAAKGFMMVAILFEDVNIVPKALLKAAQAFKNEGALEKASEALKELISRFPDSEQAEKATKLELGEGYAQPH